MPRSVLSFIMTALLLSGCSDPQPAGQSGQPAEQTTAPQAEQAMTVTESKVPPDSDAHTGQTIIYRCDDGTEFELTIMGSSAHMELENSSYEMRQQPAASGIYHAGDLWQVHSKAETALLIGPDSTRECATVATRKADMTPSGPAGPSDSAARASEQKQE